MPEEFVNDIISATPTADVATVTEVKTPTTEGPTLDKVNNSQVAPAVKTSSIEEIATQLGWRADHTGEDSVDAATYILRSKDIQKSMSKHNKDLKDQLSVLNGSVEALKSHNEKVYQAEVKKLQAEIADLKKERKAVEKGVVVAIGDTAFKDYGGGAGTLAVGDRVIIAQYSGKEVKDLDDTEYVVCNDEDILVILKD